MEDEILGELTNEVQALGVSTIAAMISEDAFLTSGLTDQPVTRVGRNSVPQCQ